MASSGAPPLSGGELLSPHSSVDSEESGDYSYELDAGSDDDEAFLVDPMDVDSEAGNMMMMEEEEDYESLDDDYVLESEEEDEGEDDDGSDFDDDDGDDDEEEERGEEEEEEEEVGLESGCGCCGEGVGSLTPSAESDDPFHPGCPVCLDTLTLDGLHRACCIPCGHVYGRSCLERWLLQHGKEIGKCPQCRRRFKQKHIINLYAPTIVVPDGDLQKELEFYREKYGSLVTEQGELLEEKNKHKEDQVIRHTLVQERDANSQAAGGVPVSSTQPTREAVDLADSELTWNIDKLLREWRDLCQQFRKIIKRSLEMEQRLRDPNFYQPPPN